MTDDDPMPADPDWSEPSWPWPFTDFTVCDSHLVQPDQPYFYGDLAIISRAVLLLLRQVREINGRIEADADVCGNETAEISARHRNTEVDALLAEIAALGARRIEDAEEGAAE